MSRASDHLSGGNKGNPTEQRSPIPWCDRRRTYCASGCSIREKSSNSGACDWEARIAAAPPAPRYDANVEPRSEVRESRPPRPQTQEPAARQPFVRNNNNQQHPRSRFANGGRKGQGGQAKPADPSAASAAAPAAAPATVAPTDAAAPAAAPAVVQPELFTAPPAPPPVREAAVIVETAPVESAVPASPHVED